MVSAISLLDNSSPSSPAACAEKDKARRPCTKDSTSATTPRTIGFFKIGYRSLMGTKGSVFTIISPEGSLTAVAIRPGPRIITPSITACPPILTFGFTVSSPFL